MFFENFLIVFVRKNVKVSLTFIEDNLHVTPSQDACHD